MARKKEALLQSAEKLVGKGKIEAAIKEYQKVLKLGEDTNTLNLIGDLYGRLRKNDEAIRYYGQAAERYANDGFYVKAIALHKKVHRIEPGRMDAHIKLAELYHRQGLATEARVHYQTLADHYQRQKDAASAIGIYQKMIDLEPGNPTPRAKLAELYKQEHLLGKAVEQYGEIASVMLQHGQADQALQVYLRALDLDASDVEFVRRGIERLREAGATAAAEQFFTTAAQRNSSVEDLRPLLHGDVSPSAAAPAPAAPPWLETPLSPATPAAEPRRDTAPAPPPSPPAPTAGGAISPPPAAPPEPPPPIPMETLPPAALETATSLEPEGLPAGLDEGPGLEGPTAELDDSFEIELEGPEELELPGAVSGSMPAVSAAPPPAATPAAEPPPRMEAADPGYEEFVLDLDADEVPSTLVQPPPDMLEGAAAQSGVPSAEADVEIELDLEGSQDLPAPAESQEFTFAPEPELETPTLSPEDVDLELTDSQLQPEVLPPASATPGPSVAPTPPAPPPPTAPPPTSFAATQAPEPPVVETAAEVGPAARSIDDLLAEAEVFVKYGLSEKAVDRLQEVLSVNPRHLGAHVQLVSLFLGQGEEEQVARLVPELARLAGEAGTGEPWNETREKLTEAGYRFEGDTLVATPGGTVARARSETEAAAPEELAVEIEPDGTEIAPGASVELMDAVDSGAQAPAAPDFVDITGLEDTAPAELERPADAFQTFVGAVDLEDLKRAGDDAGVEAPVEAAADSTSWLDELREEPTQSDEAGESLFDDEEEFFDLAAELQEDLEEPEAPADEPREQTLEEIVEGFKKGVAENLSPEDSDTHYNLGIAYREMMLLDEAIGEFQIAAKDPAYLVDCCAMLGQCFSDKGLPELALKWYRRALDSPNIEEKQALGMLYEVANAFLALNDRDSAYKTFVEIYGMNTNYRDVVARMRQLAPAESGS